ncbi:MAG TPA: hypothetical protein VMV10_25350 [Pirellulales bacterium]|nr:hypothetical protein [Pirellulales bacterium]
MMRRLFAAFSRYRPRVLTLVVLAATGALLVLANLSEECRPRKVIRAPPPAYINLDFDLREPRRSWITTPFHWNMSYGWPLLWRQYIVALSPYGTGVAGSNYNAGRLAGNAAIWLVMLAAPAGVCEWLLRRYRPRLRFSLRTLLAATGLAAALCGWFVAARNRANVQDPLIAAVEAHSGRVGFERSGPSWLEIVGADRFCRRIVGAELSVSADEEKDRRLLDELRRLPDLRYLALTADRLSPEMAETLNALHGLETLRIDVSELTGDSGKALGGMPRLRALSVGPGSYGPIAGDGTSNEWLAAVAALPHLGHLRVEVWLIASQDLALLNGAHLKSLALHSILRSSEPALLSELPALEHLESLDLQSSEVFDEDLRYLVVLPRLKALSLMDANVNETGLAELAPLETLEELVIDGEGVSLAGFEALLKLKRLKKLHIQGFDEAWLESPDELRTALSETWGVPHDETDGCLRAIAELRRSKPELMIDGDVYALDWPAERMPPQGEAVSDDWIRKSCRQTLQTWKQQQAAKPANPGVVNPPTAN